ncbi:MAG: MFS transporter [Pseudomonadota bacterium]
MAGQSQFQLLRERRFLPFFGAQALGAFNDNVYKNTLVIIATYHASTYTSMAPGTLTMLAGGLFILPFVLFSGLAGQLADRYDKSRVLQAVKVFEIAIMTLAGFAFTLHSMPLLLGALFLMGAHSTFFAPAKYGLLPQVLGEDELIGGNALLEMGTFVGILTGMLLAGLLAKMGDLSIINATLLAIAALGLGFSLAIPPLAPAAPGLRIDLNLWRSTMSNLAAARANRVVFLSILGISWFWFYGILVLAQVPLYAKEVVHGAEDVVILLLVGFSLGVGTGSLLCERLSGHRIEIGLVPLGSLGLTLFGVDLYFATPATHPVAQLDWLAFLAYPGGLRVFADVLLIGVSGGLYIVPLYAQMQRLTKPEVMSRVISANSIWNAIFMVVASLFGGVLLGRGVSIPMVLLVCGLLNFAVAAFIYARLPEFLLRFLAWAVARVLYRIRVEGLQNVPEHGAALVICNHVSFADALVLSAAVHRPMRFVMEAAIFRIPVANAIFRGMKAIPVATAAEDPAVREMAFLQVLEELRRGELVCIFPEGRLTADGAIGEFRPGLLRILREAPVPVVPVALSGLWGSSFSRRYRGLSRYLPRRLWARIDVRVGAALPAAEVALPLLRATVTALRGEVP